MLKKTLFLVATFSLTAALSFANDTYRSDKQNIPNKKTTKQVVGNRAEKLLSLLKWDDFYVADRKRDMAYLLGAIDGQFLLDLNAEQKQKIAVLTQEMALKLLLKDKQYFKQYLINQYNQFFTVDEFDKLIQYFSTDIMQDVMNARLKGKFVEANEVKEMLSKLSGEDKKVINTMTDSYLNARFKRFQEKISPIMQKMLVERIKTILDVTIAKIPELVDYLKTDQLNKNIETKAF